MNHGTIFLLFSFSILLYVSLIYHEPDRSLYALQQQAYSVEGFNNPSSVNTSDQLSGYTLLVYMIGSDIGSREYSANRDIAEMITAAADTSNVNVIIQTGGGRDDNNPNDSSNDKMNINFTKVQRHQIVNGTVRHLMDLGKKNMGQPSTLSDFINWGVSEFPARKYAIILWDHGSGINGFGKDLNSMGDILNPYEIQSAFLTAANGTGVTFELIGFDACLMSSIEIASRLQSVGRYMVASEEIEPEWGWDYKSIIKNLSNNPFQSGDSLGKSIIDSYILHSESNSIAENYGADKDITLSLIDLSKIPPLIDDVNSLSKGLRHQIFDLESAINLSRSIDTSERYGQSAKGSSGLVDLGDLIKNVQQRYPNLSEAIAAIEDSLESAIIYAHAGEARPNANGLSVYMPLTRTEFNENAEVYVVDIDWLGLLNTQKTIISSDTNPPVLKSIVSGDTISIGIYGSDISSIFAYIITNSSKGQNLMYVQNIIPSFSNDLGLFQYSNSTMASLCNENSCIPTTINIENNGDRRFAFIPVRLVSYEGDINSNISLVYEIGNDGNFEFLGGTSEIEPEGAVPKSKLNLRVNDAIYTKALPVIAPYQIVGSINSTGIRDISNYIEDGPLLVNDSTEVFPRYIPLNSSYAVSFTMCDYSDNCDKTRWYSINPPNQTSLLASFTPEPENSGRTEMSNMSSMEAGSFTTYTNPVFGFKVNYPSDWTVQTQDITDFSDYDLSADPIITQFFPPNYTGIIGSNFHPGLTISVTDWPFIESPKSLFDFIRKTYPNFKIISAGPDLVGGNPAYRFIMEYVSEEENYLGIAKDSRAEMMVTTLMDGKMYTIDFSSYSSQFNSYLPVVERIIDSFGQYVYSSENDIVSSLNRSLLNNSSVKGNGILTGPISVSTFVDELHGYSIEYPSNLGLGKPISMETLNPELMGNLFLLDNSSGSPSQEGVVYASINAFHKNESNLMQEYFRTGEIGNLDLESIIPLADEKLSVYKLLPSFMLIRNETTPIRNNIFYVIEYQYFNPAYRSMQHEKLLYMIKEDTLFIFEFGSPPSKYQQYLPVFENMVNSFQYNKNDIYARQAIH